MNSGINKENYFSRLLWSQGVMEGKMKTKKKQNFDVQTSYTAVTMITELEMRI
jgi:hypothetical protein